MVTTALFPETTVEHAAQHSCPKGLRLWLYSRTNRPQVGVLVQTVLRGNKNHFNSSKVQCGGGAWGFCVLNDDRLEEGEQPWSLCQGSSNIKFAKLQIEYISLFPTSILEQRKRQRWWSWRLKWWRVRISWIEMWPFVSKKTTNPKLWFWRIQKQFWIKRLGSSRARFVGGEKLVSAEGGEVGSLIYGWRKFLQMWKRFCLDGHNTGEKRRRRQLSFILTPGQRKRGVSLCHLSR